MKRTDYDCRLGAENFCLVFDVSFLLEIITLRGELTDCSKLTCFAKGILDMVPGGSGEWDRRSVSAAVRHRRRMVQDIITDHFAPRGENCCNSNFLRSTTLKFSGNDQRTL